jgi:hypothetical protein
MLTMLMWFSFSFLAGWSEAWYWRLHMILNQSKSYEHALWTVQRICYGSTLTLLITLLTSNIWNLLLAPVAIGCSFVFLHDGAYYWHRNILSKVTKEFGEGVLYEKKFFDESTDSVAILTNFELPIVRITCAIITLITLYYMFK